MGSRLRGDDGQRTLKIGKLPYVVNIDKIREFLYIK